MQTQFKITGMHCASCKNLIEDVCQDIPGVENCEVNAETTIATVTHNSPIPFETFQKEIGSLETYTIEQI